MSYENDIHEIPATQVELYVVAVVLSILAVIGTGGNALVLYVFSSKQDGLVSTLFITVLAVVDLTTCLFIVPFTVAMELSEFRVASDFVCKLYLFLITSNVPFSALVMAAIAVDRYLCICRPFCHLLNVARARWIVCVLALSVSCLGLGGSLTHGIYQYQRISTFESTASEDMMVNFTNHGKGWTESSINPVTEATDDGRSSTLSYNGSGATLADEWILVNTGSCAPTEVLISKEAGLAFRNCYNGVFFSCLVIVSILYAMIYQSVRQRRLWREKHKSSAISQQQHQQKSKQQHHEQQHQSIGRHSASTAVTHVETLSLIEVPVVDKNIRNSVTTSMTSVSKDGTSMTGRRLSQKSVENNRITENNKDTRRCNAMELMAHEITDTEQQLDYCNGHSIHPSLDNHGEPTLISTSCVSNDRLRPEDAISTRNGDTDVTSHGGAGRNHGHFGGLEQGSAINDSDVGRLEGKGASDQCGSGSRCILISESWQVPMTTTNAAATTTELKFVQESTTSLSPLTSPVRDCVIDPSTSPGILSSTVTEAVYISTAAVETAIDVSPEPIPTKKSLVAAAAAAATTTSLAASHKNRIANVKTAAMLFVVTLVFVITFMPALSMTMQLIPHNTTVFYMYFAYNVANPIIYSFMNQNFRKQLKRMFGKRQH